MFKFYLTRITCFYNAIFFIVLNVVFVVSVFAQTPDPALSRKLRDYLQDNAKKIAGKAEIIVGVKTVPNGQSIFSQGTDDLVHSASVQKLFITYAALKTLGADYRFPTEFYTEYSPKDRDPRIDIAGGMDSRAKAPTDSLGNLYVRAYGDPLMQYEDIQKSVRELKARGLNGIQDLVVDDSLFLEETYPSGDDAYQAAQSATSLEFNTYRLIVSAAASGQSALVSSSPGLYAKVDNKTKTLSGRGTSIGLSQTPANDSFPRIPKQGLITPIPLRIVVDGRIGINDPVWEKYHAHPEPFTYFILSLRKALLEEGITVKGVLRRSLVPSEANLIYTYESEPLYAILAKLNRYSNNFIAEQLLYAIGQNDKGIFSRRLGLENLKAELKKIDALPSNVRIVDASGLSKENRISGEQILHLLAHAEKDISVSPVFISSLSRFGLSGTLKERNLFDEKKIASVKTSVFMDERNRIDGVWAKTGTVDGVSAVAGYLERSVGFRLAFFIHLKGDIEKSRAVEIENDIVRILLGIG